MAAAQVPVRPRSLADMCGATRNVCYGPEADIAAFSCLTAKSPHLAQSRKQPMQPVAADREPRAYRRGQNRQWSPGLRQAVARYLSGQATDCEPKKTSMTTLH